MKIKNVMKVVGKDISDKIPEPVKEKSKDIGRVLWKTIAYPTLGNFEYNIRTPIERAVGEENFSEEASAAISGFTNLASYIGAVIITTKYFSSVQQVNENLEIAVPAAISYAILEGMVRNTVGSKQLGSLPGYIIGKPIKLAGKMIAYGKNVKKRAEKLDLNER